MKENRFVVGAHYGFFHWLIQRVTAFIAALYFFFIFFWFLVVEELSYEVWLGLFESTVLDIPIVKIITLAVFLTIFYHTWIGMRNIWMDYVKSLPLRLVLHVTTSFWLVACAVYAFLILWSV